MFERRSNGTHPQGRPPRTDWIDTAERDQAMFTDYYVRAMRQVDIADKYGVSQPYVSKTLVRLRVEGKVDYDRMRLQSMATLADIQARQLEISRMLAAPVTAGKDGQVVYDPETGQVVRDYGGVLKALADAANTDDKMARRFGLDAATKAEVASTVRYEIAGLDPGDLT